jgi:hypothetical protein
MFSESASVQAALTYNPAEEQQTAATEMAQAQLQLTRIRAIRVEFMAEVDLASGGLKNLPRLAALDRYELARHHHATASRKVETF